MDNVKPQKHEEDLIKEILRSKFPKNSHADIEKMYGDGLKLASKRAVEHAKQLQAPAKGQASDQLVEGATPAQSQCWANAAGLRDAAIAVCSAAGAAPLVAGACIAAAWVAYSAACNWCTQQYG